MCVFSGHVIMWMCRLRHNKEPVRSRHPQYARVLQVGHLDSNGWRDDGVKDRLYVLCKLLNNCLPKREGFQTFMQTWLSGSHMNICNKDIIYSSGRCTQVVLHFIHQFLGRLSTPTLGTSFEDMIKATFEDIKSLGCAVPAPTASWDPIEASKITCYTLHYHPRLQCTYIYMYTDQFKCRCIYMYIYEVIIDV
jgi:hypothetical protein